MISLPYIPLDEDFNLNVALLIILIHTLSKNRNDVLLLDRNKIQIFLYLIKNPSKLEGNDSNLLIVFYVQIMPDDFVMQLHRF
ncbi:hypothetical protein GJD72_14025 [Klebsiella pneumoniae]|nr:hypothetical protein [Klebsiella pneumoniae]MTF70470.1 hypothetical protein [Klebsiella pneumoniae]MTF96595.1 hypothetical protein [Klebsiella pneumoniae]MTG74588.1 hypothetical protein [Klebsiella pneumoniae]